MEFIARCLCSANSFTIPVPSGTTLNAHVCSCTSCRFASGNFVTLHAPIPEPPFPFDSPPDTLTVYVHKAPHCCGYFCKTCGSMLFGSYPKTVDGEEKVGWCVSVGNLVGNTAGNVKVDSVFFIGDTVDGGCAPWISSAIKQFYIQGRDSKEITVNDIKEMNTKYLESEEYKTTQEASTLDARCLCGGIKIRIKRKTGWTIDPSLPDSNKYPTGHCGCQTCRMFSGGEITSYVRVPLINTSLISVNEGQEEEIPWPQYLTDAQKYSSEDGFDSFLVYKSSEDVTRSKCGKCGSSISYQKVGVSGVFLHAGLFGDKKEKAGCRRDDWFDWKSGEKAVDYADEGRLLVTDWKEGVEKWRKE